MAQPFTATPNGVQVRLRVSPRAARNGCQGLHHDADGNTVLKVLVTSAPEAGRANKAVIAMLAKEWDLPKSALEIVAGNTSRNKTMVVGGDPTALMARLTHWSEQHLSGRR